MFGKNAVSRTQDFHRIANLPVREPTDWARVSAELTALLKTPQGTWSLREIQGQSLYEIGEYGGLFGPICVGGGKTLISLLAAYVRNAIRPIMMVPAALKEDTITKQRMLSAHWRIPGNIRIISYDELSRINGKELLNGHRPDLIICDEAHRLKNKRAGVTKRVLKYMKEAPETVFVAISGTMMSKSLNDFGHILRWCLKGNSPVPLSDEELKEWADALDEKVNPVKRVSPGALLDFATAEDASETSIQTARKGFFRRLSSTPGVVCTSTENVGSSLYIRGMFYDVDKVTNDAFGKLRSLWETPDGWPMTEAAVVWLRARELALGFWGVWDPRPPPEWIAARKAWASFAREVLKYSRTLETELEVVNAVDAGKLSPLELSAWRAIRPTFTVNPKDMWHDTSALDVCQHWMVNEPGIVWTDHVFFGKELARITNAMYFGADAVTKDGVHLHDVANAVRDGSVKPMSIVCSTIPCSTGKDLQPWNRNLVTAPSPSNKVWEQLLGRTHRPGQEADEVFVDVLLGCQEHWDGLNKAIGLADAAKDTMGQPQKLGIADKLLPSEYDILAQTGNRWQLDPEWKPEP